MDVEVVVPVEFQGPVMGMMSKRSGIVTGMDSSESWSTLHSDVSTCFNFRKVNIFDVLLRSHHVGLMGTVTYNWSIRICKSDGFSGPRAHSH